MVVSLPMSIGRNEKCPCGSEKKYKQCCLGKGDLEAAKRGRTVLMVSAVLLVVSILVAIFVSRQAGILSAAAGVVAIGVWLWLTAQPPKSGSGTNPSAINFGQ